MPPRASFSLVQISKVPTPYYNSKTDSRMPRIKQKKEQSSSKGILG